MKRTAVFFSLTIALAGVSRAQRPQPVAETHAALIEEALQNSSLVHGKTPFHFLMDIHPGKVLFPGHAASPAMHGTMEVFWAGPSRYKLILTTPDFSQTKIVDGQAVEETDRGDFLPRWLDDFVRALFEPFPQAEAMGALKLKMTGGGTLALPGRAPVTMPRCIEKSDRPGGITEETSIARVCFDAHQPWIEGGLEFTRYVSFKDYRPFGDQMIARTWSDDIPENIFLEGVVTRLEKLAKKEARSIRVRRPTSPSGQIRTVFISRQRIDELKEPLPEYEWPAENTEALEGWMIVYVRTDRTGKIRESYWDSSENYKLQDAGVRLALLSKLKPLEVDDAPVQIEGPMILHFQTHRGGEAAIPER
jgi:hypothetical protein